MIKRRKPMLSTRRVRLLIYGLNRTGKSVLAGSAAAVVPTLFLEVDPGGSDSLVQFGYEPDVMRIKAPEDLNDIWWGLRKKTLHNEGGEVYQCVVIDGAGELAKRAMDKAMGSAPKSASFLSEEKFPERRQWGIVTEQMRRVIRYFGDLPMHVVWVTTERKFTDSQGNVLQIGPSLNPALVDDICNACTLIGYMHLSRNERRVLRQLIIGPLEIRDIPVITGNRIGLPDEITRVKNPTFEKLLEIVQGQAKRKGE